jgi:hypothetical protein
MVKKPQGTFEFRPKMKVTQSADSFIRSESESTDAKYMFLGTLIIAPESILFLINPRSLHAKSD